MEKRVFESQMNEIPEPKESYILVDVVSDDEIYTGTSNWGNNPDKSCWKIKKVWKDGTVWKMGFPNKKQTHSFIWDERNTYTYS